MHDQPNDNVLKMKLKNFYGNEIIKWMIHHGTLKFTPPHMNSVLVETWEDFKPSSATITQKYFKKTNFPPLYPTYIATNHKACIAGTQQ